MRIGIDWIELADWHSPLGPNSSFSPISVQSVPAIPAYAWPRNRRPGALTWPILFDWLRSTRNGPLSYYCRSEFRRSMTIYVRASNAGIQISGKGMRSRSLHSTHLSNEVSSPEFVLPLPA
jgi:hypothetical protein